MGDPGFLDRSQDDWCSLCPNCAFPSSQDTDGGVPSRSSAIADDSIGSSAVVPAVSESRDEDAIPEFMSYDQKMAEAKRQLAHGPEPLMKTVEWRQVVQGLTPVERNPLAPPPLTWDTTPPSSFERDYFQFVHALNLRAFSMRVQRSGLGTAALRVFLLRVQGFMLHLAR